MQIRAIEPKDDAALQAIIKVNLKNNNLVLPGTAYYDPELAHLSAYYATHAPSRYFVLVDDMGAVLGGVGVAPFDLERGIAELQKLYIAPNEQGKGYSKMLMDAALAFAQTEFKALYLETHTNLVAALGLYDRYGFERLSAPIAGSEHSTMNVWMLKKFS
ncbi:GNAT family N-acetyltransferase [Periweissella cryptocerci]|uniref:GNAT family N-acetyltransferase n=1 Tax=Periweissella cryptocerci TaxID=2506420 RepID=A0A4P6YWD7_9LACO|nr:GNAT family N-acetyltransferase [Periweissella cryptocerci]QBO37154.1 GNAT family N-acetyltransferase [Periweissella cryptocerci]